jgi:hypothetical protein
VSFAKRDRVEQEVGGIGVLEGPLAVERPAHLAEEGLVAQAHLADFVARQGKNRGARPVGIQQQLVHEAAE